MARCQDMKGQVLSLAGLVLTKVTSHHGGAAGLKGVPFAAPDDCSPQRLQSQLRRLVQQPQQGLRSTGRAAFALFPIADGFWRHVDAACQLDLAQAHALTHLAGELGGVLHCGSIVGQGLASDVRFRGGGELGGVDAPEGLPSGRLSDRLAGDLLHSA